MPTIFRSVIGPLGGARPFNSSSVAIAWNWMTSPSRSRSRRVGVVDHDLVGSGRIEHAALDDDRPVDLGGQRRRRPRRTVVGSARTPRRTSRTAGPTRRAARPRGRPAAAAHSGSTTPAWVGNTTTSAAAVRSRKRSSDVPVRAAPSNAATARPHVMPGHHPEQHELPPSPAQLRRRPPPRRGARATHSSYVRHHPPPGRHTIAHFAARGDRATPVTRAPSPARSAGVPRRRDGR